jgi:hypothetical protein
MLSTQQRGATIFAVGCPYPTCDQAATFLPQDPGTCNCQYRNSVRACAECHVFNVANARFCRGCGTSLPVGKPAAIRAGASIAAAFTELAGKYFSPAKFTSGFLWCVDQDGQVSRISPAGGGVASQWAKLPDGFGLDPFVLVDVSDGRSDLRGPILLAAHKRTVCAVSLLEPNKYHTLYESERPLHLTTSVDDAGLYFRGIGGHGPMYCMLQRNDDESASLAVRYLSK